MSVFPRLKEFFEGEDRRLSGTRYQMLAGWHVAAFVVIYQTITRTLTTELFTAFLLYSCGVYGLNSLNSKQIRIKEIEATQPPPIPVPVPVAPAGPTTVIQVSGDAKTQPVKDVNIQAEGDVNVQRP